MESTKPKQKQDKSKPSGSDQQKKLNCKKPAIEFDLSFNQTAYCLRKQMFFDESPL